MNRITSTALALGAMMLTSSGFDATAQNRHGIGIHFGGLDFYGPQASSYLFSEQSRYSYNESRSGYDTAKRTVLAWSPMVRFTYWYEASELLDINTGLTLASLQYPQGRPDSSFINRFRYNQAGENREQFYGQLEARVNFNILGKSRFVISPYVLAGVEASYHDIYFGTSLPVGVGAHINLSRDRALSLNLESSYKIAATEHVQNHLQHTAGFIYWFKPGYRPKTKAQELAEVLPPPDADNDGVTDSLDRCPSIAGPPRFAGCPDSDNDGVPDSRDECPLVAGDSSMNGCPDSDGDGINDKVDQCPYVAGTAERNGCPVPDKDGDGFNDNEDRCPDVYSKTNGGCPEIRREIIQQVERAAKAIFFETGKATIRKVSFKPLDQVVAVLRSNPELYADIEGHTDDVGDDASNMDLSQRRAQAVMDYFTSKGIAADRLTAKGYGETQPIATNETATGKAQNRRTEINLRNYRQ